MDYKFVVVVDAGHGGAEVGGKFTNILEKDINLNIALSILSYLKDYPEIKVIMTRTKDVNVELSTRVHIAEQEQANLFISIHNNAGGGYGFEVYHRTKHAQGSHFAKLIENELKAIGLKKRYVGSGLYAGEKEGDYYVLGNLDIPACLVESAFIDTSDYQNIDEIHEILAVGKAYSRAILKYFNISIIDISLNPIDAKVTKLESDIRFLRETILEHKHDYNRLISVLQKRKVIN